MIRCSVFDVRRSNRKGTEVIMNFKFPGTPGSYCLLLFLPRRTRIIVGRLGSFEFKRGYYLYVGSAFGPGGVSARVRRHLVRDKSKHWHIDYLRAETTVKAVWVDIRNGNMEHQWSQSLLKPSAQCGPIHRFGCSDCTCPSHLFHFKRSPDPKVLAQSKSLTQFRVT